MSTPSCYQSIMPHTIVTITEPVHPQNPPRSMSEAIKTAFQRAGNDSIKGSIPQIMGLGCLAGWVVVQVVDSDPTSTANSVVNFLAPGGLTLMIASTCWIIGNRMAVSRFKEALTYSGYVVKEETHLGRPSSYSSV